MNSGDVATCINHEHELNVLRKRNRKLEKALRNHTRAVHGFICRLDVIMRGPVGLERGNKIAELSNTLEIANDSVMHFDLEMDFKKIKKMKQNNQQIK